MKKKNQQFLKTNKVRLIFEFILNFAVIAMGIGATIWGFIDVSGDIGFCKWFTNLSNWLMILSFIVYFTFLCLKTTKVIKDIPQGIYIFQLTGTVAAALTLFGVLFFLLPAHPTLDLFAKYNLFFHMLLPLFGMLTFILTEHNPKLKFRYLWFCIIPMEVYFIFYFTNCVIHSEIWWQPDDKYDWYGIFAFLKQATPAAFLCMPIFQFGIGWLLWFLNRRIHFGYPKPDPYFKKSK